MARVPGKMYRKITQRPYTRREFMGGVPASRIIQYQSGNPRTQFPVELNLISHERGQLRHTALEAMRITAVRWMDKKVGRENYHLVVRVYPHHVIRQNKQASGAGADRVSMGMRLAFGKPIGTAARIEAGQAVLTIRTVARALEFGKDAMRKAYNKIAMPCHIDMRTTDGSDLQKVIAEAHARGNRALAGAGAMEEPAEAEGADEATEDEDDKGAEAKEGAKVDAKGAKEGAKGDKPKKPESKA